MEGMKRTGIELEDDLERLAEEWHTMKRKGATHVTGMMNLGTEMAITVDEAIFAIRHWRERALSAEEMKRRQAETFGEARDFIAYLLNERETW
jgi:hypothetical protein